MRPAAGSDAWWQQITQAQPDYLLITFSRKDADGEGSGSDIKKIVERAKRAKIQPVLITSLPKVGAKGKDGIDLDTDPAAQTLARIAKETDTPLIDH